MRWRRSAVRTCLRRRDVVLDVLLTLGLLLSTLGAAWLALQVAFGWGFVNLGDFDTWEWERFRGLSDNANQLALFCAVLGLLSLYLAEAARGLGERVAAVTCMVVAIVAGRL